MNVVDKLGSFTVSLLNTGSYKKSNDVVSLHAAISSIKNPFSSAPLEGDDCASKHRRCKPGVHKYISPPRSPLYSAIFSSNMVAKVRLRQAITLKLLQTCC